MYPTIFRTLLKQHRKKQCAHNTIYYNYAIGIIIVYNNYHYCFHVLCSVDSNCDNACPEMSSCMQTADNSYVCECEYGYEQLTPGAACEGIVLK